MKSLRFDIYPKTDKGTPFERSLPVLKQSCLSLLVGPHSFSECRVTEWVFESVIAYGFFLTC